MESKSHKNLKNKLAGKSGKTEFIKENYRLDVKKKRKVIEIEKSGNINKALKRLSKFSNFKKELKVPQKDLLKAKIIALKKANIKKLTISNLSGTKKIKIKK